MSSHYRVHAIKAFNDNYIWAITNELSSDCVVVDPGDNEAVVDFLATNNLTLTAILITHHHFDHVGGVAQLRIKFPTLNVFGPLKEAQDTVLQPLIENDTIIFDSLGLSLRVIEVPGHTLGHIAYTDEHSLFCGDTLFAAGCGRMFEGTPFMFHQSLSKLMALPSATKVYCAHEYTLSNLDFANTVEPNSHDIQQRILHCQHKRSLGEPTLPSTIEEERATNPFLRIKQPKIVESLNTKFGLSLTNDPIDNFKWLRQWKDSF